MANTGCHMALRWAMVVNYTGTQVPGLHNGCHWR